jgi:hypothetical protein
MDDKELLQGATTADDTGATFGHVSRELESLLEEFGSLKSKKIAELGSVPDLSPAKEFDNNTLASYDPLARELKIPDVLYDRFGHDENLDIIIKSLIEAHEYIHYDLVEQESHFYLNAMLESFQAPLLAVRESIPPIYQKIADVAFEANTFITRSILFHEGKAVTTQLNFLRSHNQSGEINEYISMFDYPEHLTEFLNSGESPETYLENLVEENHGYDLGNHPEHAFGPWCWRKVQERWDIDVFRRAFKFQSEAKRDLPTGKSTSGNLLVPPDVVLTRAAFTDQPLESTPEEQQEKLLIDIIRDHYQKRGSKSKPLFEQTATRTGEIKLHDRQEAKRRLRRQKLQTDVTQGGYFLVPLHATDYPGCSENQNLWNILTHMYVVKDVSGSRHLSCHKDILSWAKNTQLLRLAIQIWRLREILYIPIFRAISQFVIYKPRKTLQAVRDHEVPSGIISSRSTGSNPQKYEIVEENYWNHCSQFNPNKFEGLCDELQKLGRAILNENKRTVRSYL